MKDKLKDKMKKKFTDLSISHKMLMVYITFASAFLLIALGLTQISFRIYSKELYDKSLQELDYFSQNVNRGLKDAERNNYSISMDALVQRTLSDLSVLEYPSLDYNQKIRDLRRILLNEYDPESCVKSIIFVDLYGNTVEVGTAAWDVSGESFTAIKKQMEQGKGAYTTYGPTEATEMFHILKNAENPHFYGFRLHTFRTTDKVIRYGINNQFDFAEHPAVIQRGEKRTINICVAVPDVA